MSELVRKIMPYTDSRGYFTEIARADIKQVNQSFSKRGVIRGLHLQSPAVTKHVWVAKGRIYDVAFNPETGKHVAEVLSDDNHKTLTVPKGWAHGFQALEDSVILYAMDGEYNKDGDMAINPLSAGIEWPLDEYIISDKDKNAPSFDRGKHE